MKYPSKLLKRYNRFYRRLLYHKSPSSIIIVDGNEIYSIRAINIEVQGRTEEGLRMMKKVFELGLR